MQQPFQHNLLSGSSYALITFRKQHTVSVLRIDNGAGVNLHLAAYNHTLTALA
jgi:hypothetical protein